MGWPGVAVTLFGRADERARLLDVVLAGLDGSPRAVLVRGEAGIGKTSLVRSVCGQAQAQGAQVLWGQCLRFAAVEAMYHPLVLALEGWLGEADDADKAAMLEAVPGAALILPSLGASPIERPSMLMMVVDALLSRVVARGPTVLVVDDVQWADPASLDALAYLVAGFGRQRLTLVTTYRDEAAGSDGFQHWLGNVRRLPGTEELVLTRLDELVTGDQIAGLLGESASPLLVRQVFERSRGNPYFSELLVRRGDLGSAELPADLPDELSHALLEAWRGLSPTAQEMARILAVAGRPADLLTLGAVAAAVGISQARSVREAVDAGVVVLDGVSVWFRHPLLAGVLAETYLPGEAAPVHRAWAVHLGSVSTDGIDELRRLGDLATHHERAGDGSSAFALLLQGADLADKLGARREAADLLARAADLWDVGADAADVTGRARLLERAGLACSWVGRERESYRMFRSALDLISAEREPLWASRLMMRVAGLAFQLGEARDVPLVEAERVVELTRVDPDSREHAEALRSQANVLFWEERGDEARRVLEDAVAAAHRSRSAVAISRAHGTRAELVWDTDVMQAERDATICWEQALTSGEREAIAHAYFVRQALSHARGDLRREHEDARDAHQWLIHEGNTLFPSVILAEIVLAMGDLLEAAGIVRTGLAATGNAGTEASIRLEAGVLAARRGATDAARAHLARAREIMPYLEERPGLAAAAPIAEMLLAEDEPAAAFALLERLLPSSTVDPRALDELMVLGARAAADLVQRASDERDQAGVDRHREALTRLTKTRARLPGSTFQLAGPDDTVQLARAALFAAELDRAQGSDDQVRLWRDAVTACDLAGLGWEQQTAAWRLSSALLESGAPGSEAAEILRRVHDYALRQGAALLMTRVESLAASARISLAVPLVPPSRAVPVAFTGLTARETEVLAHLVATRTNAEIAQSLFISEKTVSVHVSNLLRKTGTGSRREVAALARRVGWDAGA